MKKLWDRKFFLFVLGIAVPIMVQNAITNFVALLDNIMIGQLGTEEMSGVAIINQLLFVFNVTLFGACAGAGIFTSQFHGSGNPDGVRQTFRYKLLLGGILLAASLLVLCLWGTPLIQAWLHQSSSTAVSYTHLGAGILIFPACTNALPGSVCFREVFLLNFLWCFAKISIDRPENL